MDNSQPQPPQVFTPMPTPPQYTAPVQQAPTNVLGIIGFILGLIAFLSSAIALVGLIGFILYMVLPIAGLTLSIFGMRHVKKKLALTGIILSGLGILGAIGFVIIGSIASASYSSILKKANDNAAANQSTVDQTTSTAPTYKINEAAQADGYTFTVTSVTRNWQGSKVKLYPAPMDEYIHVVLSFTNTSSSSVVISPMLFSATLDGATTLLDNSSEQDGWDGASFTLASGKTVAKSVDIYYTTNDTPTPKTAEIVYYPRGGSGVQRVILFQE